MRLIDADALKEKFEEDGHLSGYVEELIDDCPTVNAVKVVHGRWIFGTANHREYMKCSVCLKSQTPTGVFTYCPNCGAEMGEEATK
jgi:hypothetical protein